jgi:hypothetical protein
MSNISGHQPITQCAGIPGCSFDPRLLLVIELLLALVVLLLLLLLLLLSFRLAYR